MNAKRVLKKVKVNFISLVKRGANNKTIIHKSNEEGLIQILKYDEDKRLVYGVVYSPDEVDAQGDVASKEVIEQMAYDFMKSNSNAKVDLQHNYNPDQGFIAESWIVKENESFLTDAPAGSWAVAIKIENDETWQKVKSGELSGLSMAGMAETEEVKKDNEHDSSAEIIKSIKDLEERISFLENSSNGSTQVKTINKNQASIWL